MSLTPIGMAFGIVAILFIWFAAMAARATEPPPPKSFGAVVGKVWLGAAVEALLLVLFASLWFASLGHGGWLLVFLLLGALVAGGEGRTRHRLLGTSAGLELRLLLLALARYVIAGLVSVWLLS